LLVLLCCGDSIFSTFARIHHDRLLIVRIYLSEQVYLYLTVFDLLLNVEVHSVVVRGKLIPFEELNRCLIKLQNYDLVQKAKTFYVLTSCIYALGEIGDLCNLLLFAHEKGFEGLFTFEDVLQTFSLLIPLRDLLLLAFFHFILLSDSLEDSFDVQYFKLEPSYHYLEWILHLLWKILYFINHVCFKDAPLICVHHLAAVVSIKRAFIAVE